MLKNIFLQLILVLLAITNSFSQNNQTKDNNQIILFEGIMDSTNKSNYVLSECIANSVLLMGVESKTETEEDAKESSFVEGQYYYSYYVNDYETQAGNVEFKFKYFIENSKIHFKIYDFIHTKGNSEFNSLGLLPMEWNEKIGKTFSENQYIEIMSDLVFNALNSLRIINENCAK